MNYNEQRTRDLESTIRTHLTLVRLQNPTDYAIAMLALYEYITNIMPDMTGCLNQPLPLYAWVSTGVFNKTIGDMKKAGVIGTAKGGDVVFLSNAAWELYAKKYATNQHVIKALAISAATSNEVSK
jgi:hypothetical protein